MSENKPLPHSDSQRAPGPKRGQSMWGSLVAFLFLLALFVMVFSPIFSGSTQRTPISFTRFRAEVTKGNVEQVLVQGQRIEGKLKKEIQVETEGGKSKSTSEFLTYYPPFEDARLLELLESKNVEIQTKPEETSSWTPILLALGPVVLILVFFLLISRQFRSTGQGLFSMGKNRAKLYDRRREHTTFRDVAGLAGAKEELEEIVAFLRHPLNVERVGGEMPKGVLLFGPPGTGKTLLARAIAGEAEVPFFSIGGSDFMEMFVGVGASRVRELFADAKKGAPSIVFIDELDSIGRRRGTGLGGGHDEREQTLNQLLSEMDGFEPNVGVIVIAATNRPDILDPALLRPGRFDRRISINLPTLADRTAILAVHARNKPLDKQLSLEDVARGTPGFSGADLANLLNEAALLAARREKRVIDRVDVEEARDKLIMGLRRDNLSLSRRECELLAYHEAGHAVVAAVVPNGDPVHKITIVPRGRSMGHTEQLPAERYVYERDYLLDRLAVMMGGRAAEELFRETSTSGAEADLKQATSLARKMVLEWGMGHRLNRVALGEERDEVFLGREIAQRREYSEATAREVDEEVLTLLEGAYGRAKQILLARREKLERLVERLLKEEELPGETVLQLVGESDKVAAAEVGG